MMLFAAMILLVYLVLGLIWLVRRQRKKVHVVWAHVASLFDGQFDAKHGPWYNRRRRIDLVSDAVAIAVEHLMVGDVLHTRGTASAEGCGRLYLHVYPKNALTGLGRALGFQDVNTGDAAFDEAYVVKCNDEDLARAWLSDDVRAAIRATEGYAFAIKDGTLTALRSTLESEARNLEAMVRACAIVATRGRHIHQTWQRFAEGREGSVANNKLRIEIDDASVPLRIEAQGLHQETATRTRIEGRVVGGKGAVFEATAEEEWASLGEAVQAKLARVAPLHVASDGERVTVMLKGVETDEARLREACELAAELATRQSLTYR